MHLDVNTLHEPEEYLRYIRRKGLFLIGAGLVLVLLFLVALAIGSSFIPLPEVIAAFLSPSGEHISTIVLNIRRPGCSPR